MGRLKHLQLLSITSHSDIRLYYITDNMIRGKICKTPTYMYLVYLKHYHLLLSIHTSTISELIEVTNAYSCMGVVKTLS